MNNVEIAYIVSDLKRVGPTNQTLNIINNSKYKNNSVIITLFDEPDDSMIDTYKKNNIRIICLHLNKHTYMFQIKKLKNVLIKERVTLIHSYGIRPDFMSYIVSKQLNMHHIITLRNYPKEDILTRMDFIKGYVALYTHLYILKNSNYVVCCSKTIMNKMKRDYPKHKFYCIQNGVDLNRFYTITSKEQEILRRKLQLPTDKTIFISTGSFIVRKRIPELIAGFQRANRDNSILVLLGTGELYDELKEKYQSKSVIFLGKKVNVSDYLQCADFFVSTSESEGLPNGALEALACGVNVLLSNIGQHMEILNGIENAGISYKLGDVNDLALKIRSVKKKKNIDMKDSNFTMERMSKNYVSLYEKILY